MMAVSSRSEGPKGGDEKYVAKSIRGMTFFIEVTDRGYCMYCPGKRKDSPGACCSKSRSDSGHSQNVVVT
jgi:hypothetical protein